MERFKDEWRNLTSITAHYFTCGYCGNKTGTSAGYQTGGAKGFIVICGGCNRPTFFEQNANQTPRSRLGNDVEHLPAMLEKLYLEARDCTQVGAFTACVLTCRKILMHVAVEQGAKENQIFIKYVEYLANSGFVPPNGKGWVDHIRTRGNEANHEVVLMSEVQALELLSFTEMLLKFIYEFPARIAPSGIS